jgi:outer membrane lipoprotein-sorting protein
MKNLSKNYLLWLITIFCVSPIQASTDYANEGYRISSESKTKNSGWVDSQVAFEMSLKSKNGEESNRLLRISSLEQPSGGEKSLVIFDSPSDLRGTALLTFSHPKVDNEQWLYLPAAKRVKRISSNNKNGSFMGSEFSFEDLTSFELEKYTYRYLKDEKYNDVDCFVVEQTPVDKSSGYSRRMVWIDKLAYRTHKVEFFDRRNTLLKTLAMSDFEQYLDKFWRAKFFLMTNHQTGKSTLLTWKEFKFKTGLSDNAFDQNALKRAR